MRRLVLASNNAKKLAELQTLLEPLAVELLPQQALGITETEEPHATFLENALAKARHAAADSGLPALADDSGLCVEALGGAPGVRSARYAASFGEVPTDATNNQLLLRALGATAQRQARFVCVLVALRSAEDPEPLVAWGRWTGEVLTSLRGQGGFGYDPLIWLPSLQSSVAELPVSLKNQLSHRAQATQAMLDLLRQFWRWDKDNLHES